MGQALPYLDLVRALHSSRILYVGSGATTTSIPYTGPVWPAYSLNNAGMTFLTGPAAGQSAVIDYNTTNPAVLVVNGTTLANAPNEGDLFAVSAGVSAYVKLAVPTGNAATTLTVALNPVIGTSGEQPLWKSVRISFNNQTDQTIISGNLYFTETLNAAAMQTDSLDIGLGFSSIVAGANKIWTSNLTKGVLRHSNVSVVFSAAPTTGYVDIELLFSEHPMGGLIGGDGQTALQTDPIPFLQDAVTGSDVIGLWVQAFLDAYNPTTGKADMLRIDPTTHHLWTRDDATGATGAAVPTSAALVGGTDGTDLRALATDVTGAVKLAAGVNSIGAVTEVNLDAAIAANGAATPTKGILVLGSDGTDARAILTDAAGSVKLAAGTNSIGAVTANQGTAGAAAWLVDPSASRRGTLTDRSGTITLGGTAQQLAAASATRKYLVIENLDAAEDLWFNFTTTAVASQPSLKLAAGQSFTMEASFVSTELVSVIAATTGHAWAAKEG